MPSLMSTWNRWRSCVYETRLHSPGSVSRTEKPPKQALPAVQNTALVPVMVLRKLLQNAVGHQVGVATHVAANNKQCWMRTRPERQKVSLGRALPVLCEDNGTSSNKGIQYVVWHLSFPYRPSRLSPGGTKRPGGTSKKRGQSPEKVLDLGKVRVTGTE